MVLLLLDVKPRHLDPDARYPFSGEDSSALRSTIFELSSTVVADD